MSAGRSLLARTASLLIGGFAIFVIVKLASEAGGLGSLDWSAFSAAVAWAGLLSLANYGLRFVRWQMFLARLGSHPRAGPSALCYVAGFAFTLLPGKAGELIRARYYAQLGVGADRVGAAFVMERLMDLGAICLLCMFGLGALTGVSGLAAWVVGFAAALCISAAALTVVLRWAEKHFSGQASKAGAMLRPIFRHGRDLMEPSVLVSGLAIGITAWALEGVGFWMLAQASGLADYGLGHAVAVYSASLLAGAVSFMPGGLGSTEAVMLLSLKQAGAPGDAALAVTLLCRLATLWLAVLLGWLAVAALAVRRSGGANAG